jgi:serine/threonine protein kinase/class 3 adenylate cyclase
MTMASDSPAIRVGTDEQREGISAGLAVLFAEISGSVMPGDLANANVANGTTVQHIQLVTKVIQEHQGQIIKKSGSSVMAEFASPLAAVRAAADTERLLAESNQTSSQDDQLGLRIGIHGLASSCRRIDLLGSMVHVAVSITKYATAGRILVSREVCDAISSERDIHFQWFRKVSIDGLKENEDIFELHWAPSAVEMPSRYEALFQVGTGGMGIVYKVRDKETNEIVALKVLRSEIAADPTMKENLKREVCLARRVTHKNVCRIHEFNRSNGTAYISMEFVEGESLLSALQRSGPLAWNEALKIVRQICAGLGEAHAQGIVHRDLKPANIMMDRSGVVKIMDFGIAHPFQGTGQMTGTLMGTAAYMAPEQVELKSTDARTDIYALGLLLYEIVTGSPAFSGDTPIAVALKQLREFPKLPRAIASTLPPHAEAVILKCMEKDPSKRFQAMDELAAALRSHAHVRPAVSLWGSFTADLQHSGHDLFLDLQPRVQAIGQLILRQNWRSLTNKRKQRTLALGLGAASLVGGLGFLTLRNTAKNQSVDSVSLGVSPAASDQSSRSSVSQSLAADNTSVERPLFDKAVLSITAHEVDLGSGSGLVSRDSSSLDLELPSTRLSSTDARASRAEKTRPVVRIPLPSKAITSAKSSPVTVQTPLQPPAPVVFSASVAQKETSSEQETEETGSDLSASVLPTTPSAAHLETANEGNVTAGSPTPTGYFIEVGSFKDPTWANHAVEKLTQLGFQAISVRKNVLWVRSYQVRVGPYMDLKAFEVARLNLVSQGFKPHAIQ